ncbi:ankyrin repeat domain-containing protein [Paenibacillus sp. HJGM_3]|uniref:ankyrin repeat domain-containing protein n=1 Tax=Paenibacillus sp. HJGM_3 TaxID=3379816 RepID=UPI00385B889E
MRKQEDLMKAAERGETATVLRLLEEGADINGTDAQGRTPVMAATYHNRVDTVRALIEAGADLNVRDHRQDNPLLYAGAAGLLDIVRLVVQAGADTRLTNRFGGTALIPACERGHLDVVEALLTLSDVDVNHVNRLGWTALLEAVLLSDGGPVHQRIVKLLLEHGADVHIPDKDGVTALQHAERLGYTEMVRLMELNESSS